MLKLNEKSAKSTYIILALSIIMLVIVGIRLYSDTYAAFMQKDIASQFLRNKTIVFQAKHDVIETAAR